ncbi:MAG: anthranilate synthase component I family protein [Phycisphaerales bacterium]|nr:anthranilate synthase component I family protein [Phycisphaerales bacterium]MCB9837364.1 anthranilate synthase component I family protein [Phycisphaera sp.]
MSTLGNAIPRPIPASVADAMVRWPVDEPLVALIGSSAASHNPHSLLARPTETRRFDSLAAFLDSLDPKRACIQSTPPFGPGWVVSIAYHGGHELEPKAVVAEGCIHTPAVIASRIEAGMVFDHRLGRTHTFGETLAAFDDHTPTLHRSCTLGPVRGLERQPVYTEAVRRVVELINAGDAFQVNLAHRPSAAFAGSTRALAARLCASLAPWHGCYIETASASPDDIAAVVSMSPELFLQVSPDGHVRTRPMKGTRPGSSSADELAIAPKDRAELAMIVDLMRNDLGRVCQFGSVRVTQDRVIEPHGGTPAEPAVWQGVATVEGTLRADQTRQDLIRAAFPPGSVTGAPKVRAMQIIDELEQSLGFAGTHTRRGPYCGACGFIGDDGSMMLNVAIRTAIVTGIATAPGVVPAGEASYPVGAGIVADSDPESEWLETLDKARPFLDLTASGRSFTEE